MKFEKQQQNGTRIIMEIDENSTLDEVFDAFTHFLRAVGYVIEYNQVLDLVEAEF